MRNPPPRKRASGSKESSEVGVQETTMYAVDLFDRANPKSVINLLPQITQAKVFSAAHDRPDLFRMPEKELKKASKPTPTECRLRLAFWNEFNIAMSENSTMTMANVFAGICTQQYFDQKFMNEPVCVAWLLCPPANYVIALEEMLSQSQSRLREILELDPVTEHGEINLKLAELQFKIHLAVESRLKGSTVQRAQVISEHRNTNLNVNATVETKVSGELDPARAEAGIQKALSGMTLAEIEAKLARVKKAQSQDLSWKKPTTTIDGVIVSSSKDGAESK